MFFNVNPLIKLARGFLHLLPKPPTYFYVHLIDGRQGVFVPPMPQPGIKLMSVQLDLFMRDLNPGCFSDLATTAVVYWPDLILYPAYLAEDEHVLAELVRFPHLEVQGHVLVLPLHLVGDLVEERGPDLESNPVSFKYPTINAKPIFPL